MKSVIFDLDGTLADTSGDLIAAANACFSGMADQPLLDPVADQEVAFNGGRAMIRLGLSRLDKPWNEDDVDAQFVHFLQYYADHIDVFTTLYQGVETCLDQLTASGFALGICTNKPAGLAQTLLERLGVRDRFDAMLGADSLAVKKPDPEHLFATIRQLGGVPAQSVLIGDTITDRKTAENADIPCVLVTFGPKSRDVTAMRPAALLDHYDDLPKILTDLGL